MTHFSDFREQTNIFKHSRLIESSYLRAESRGIVIQSAVIDGFQTTPASKYHLGVDVALLQYQCKKLDVPDGLYKLNVHSLHPIKTTGTHEAISTLTNAEEEVIHECPHIFDVTSVDLPGSNEEMEVATQVNSFVDTFEDHTFSSHEYWTINYCCKNGTCGTCIGSACPVQK